jgi:dihydrofolate reductase
MPYPARIEGLAIVSADGMIADAAGIQPPSLKLEADQRFFFDMLNRSQAVIHGRNSGEGGPDAIGRPRIILTRRVSGVAWDGGDRRTVLWNPEGCPFDEACAALDWPGGTATVIGGTDVFGRFLEIGYNAFHLTRAADAHLPGGRPVFPGVPARAPEDLMRDRGLKPGAVQTLDAAAALTLMTWTPA